MTDVFGSGDHEQVVFCRDESSGLRAIIAIHSTALGPALGGTRFHPYPSEDDALQEQVIDAWQRWSFESEDGMCTLLSLKVDRSVTMLGQYTSSPDKLG